MHHRPAQPAVHRHSSIRGSCTPWPSHGPAGPSGRATRGAGRLHGVASDAGHGLPRHAPCHGAGATAWPTGGAASAAASAAAATGGGGGDAARRARAGRRRARAPGPRRRRGRRAALRARERKNAPRAGFAAADFRRCSSFSCFTTPSSRAIDASAADGVGVGVGCDGRASSERRKWTTSWLLPPRLASTATSASANVDNAPHSIGVGIARRRRARNLGRLGDRPDQ